MIGIIYVGQIELSPFVKKYTDIFDKFGVKYDIIHWDRSGDQRHDNKNMFTYTEQLDRYKSVFGKLLPLLRFRRFAKKLIKKRKYDRLIVLTTQTAVILPDVLFRYRGRYFFDYRDTSYEYIALYRAYINTIIKRSYASCISSPGFRKYLTDEKPLLIAHNFQDGYYQSRRLSCIKKPENEKIIIGYIGILREYDYLTRLCDCFGQDLRFEFHIHGGGDDLTRLSDYSKRFFNVFVHGAYKESDKCRILDDLDMICYNYPTSFVNYPAVANKLYDGLIMKKPMFGNLRTFSGELIASNGLGISLDEDDTKVTEKIYEYYRTFSPEEFSKSCESYLEKVIAEDVEFTEKIKSFSKD